MAKFAKFISDTQQIKYAPRTLKEPEFICFNFDKASPEILNSRGYYEVVETNSIEDVQDETHYARPTYSLGDEQIDYPRGEYDKKKIKKKIKKKNKKST